MSKPNLPIILGHGPLADEMRRMVEADPDRYRPTTYSMKPVAWCDCCKRRIHRVKNRYTNWEEGFAPMEADDAVHPILSPEVGCCCEGTPHRLLAKRPRAKAKGKS